MIVIVCSKIPPEHSGAGSMNYCFFKYLQNNYNVKLITYTNSKDKDIITLKKFSFFSNKTNQILNFVYSFFQIIICLRNLLDGTQKNAWLVSTCSLTFASSITLNFFGFNIITQNTLVGSDDPAFKYPGDFLSIKYYFKRFQYYLSNHVTCVSPALFNITQCYHQNCSMIPNPVSKHFTFNEKTIFDKVLFVGALGYRKGIDIVLKTINYIHKHNPSVEFTLVGPKEDFDKILMSMNEEIIFINWNKVFFKGFQENTQPFFKESSIFFMPSRREGFGIVFIEAMASGLPVVAKNLEGITDYIFGEDYESILDTEQPEKYAVEILNLIIDQKKYQRLSKIGLELVKKFDEDTIFSNYLNLIENI